MTIQGPVTQWVTDHRKHHALSDQEGDPHSPHAGFAPNAWGALKGFFHAHMGWLFHLKGMERGDHYGKDLYDDRLIRGIDRMYFVWVVLSFALPFAVGYAVGGASWKLGLEVLVWGGLIRIFAYQHATFSVNSICHMFGRRELPLARREPQQLDRRRADLRRGLAQQPPRVPGLGPARPRSPSARHRVDHDPDAREARPRLERAACRARLSGRGAGCRLKPPSTPSAWNRVEPLLPTPVDPRAARAAGAAIAPDRRRTRRTVQAARDERVGAFDAERPRTLEAAPRARRADAGDPRQVAVPGAVEDVEPLAAEPVERQPLGNPRREAEHAGRRPDAPRSPIETAPPIENPTSSDGRATRSSAAAPSAMHESSSFHVLIR